MPAGRVAGYADYMVTDKSEGKAVGNVSEYMANHGGTRADGRAELFTRAGEVVNRDRFIEASQSDPRVWTIIVSPQHGNQLDLPAFAQKFMATVEQDMGRSLDWLAVEHRNTATAHLHFLVRGRDRQGKVLNFPPAYVQRGMRYRAMAIQAQVLSRTRTVKPSTPSRAEVITQFAQQAARVASKSTSRSHSSNHLSW